MIEIILTTQYRSKVTAFEETQGQYSVYCGKNQVSIIVHHEKCRFSCKLIHCVKSDTYLSTREGPFESLSLLTCSNKSTSRNSHVLECLLKRSLGHLGIWLYSEYFLTHTRHSYQIQTWKRAI